MLNIFGRFGFLVGAVFLCGCIPDKSVRVTGNVDYAGSSDIYIAKQPLHYKYAEKINFPVSVSKNGSFQLSVPVDSTQIIEFYIDDEAYPVVAQPGTTLRLDIRRSEFPASVEVSGYAAPWDSLYTDYYEQEEKLLGKINAQLSAFREGDVTNVPELYKKRYELAQSFFEETPLAVLAHKAGGEYLVKRLEEVTYHRNQAEFNPEKKRREILEEAKSMNFFSFESLHAQRAGIRDFTNAFANTFGVADSLEEKFGQELIQYDVKRLGYPTLDSARTSVLQHIDGRRARAYSEMHLIAERIGEMPLEVATPSYERFLNEYRDFPSYTSFLKKFYAQIKSVSPGQPAVPFTLPNAAGEKVQMEDFKGKYVLLDFWASWCIPCLEEFDHMKKIYNNYPRDQFEIVAISIEEDSLRWRRALQRFQNPWPQLYGGNGFQQKTFRSYRGGGIPFYMLIGPEGTILRYNDVRPSFNLTSILDSLITQQN